MRIFGGHDYYDSAQAFGHDPTVVLQRRDDWQIDVGKDGAPDVRGRHYQHKFVRLGKKYRYYRDTEDRVNIKGDIWYPLTVEIIFCGMRYRGICMAHNTTLAMEFFWQKEPFDEWLARCGYYYAEKTKATFWMRDQPKLFRIAPCSSEEIEYMRQNRISIMSWFQARSTSGYWRVNMWDLKDYKFFKVHEATQAFQKLDMWISSILGKPANEMIEVSNEVRIAKHGFDKHSFRTSTPDNEKST